MEWGIATVVTVICLTFSVGCVVLNDSSLSSQSNSSLHDSHTDSQIRTITDMAGYSVHIPADPRRVALFSGPIAQIPYILGVQDRIIATTPAMKQSRLLREIDPGLINLSDIRGSTGEVDYELLKISGADLVIAPPLDAQLIKKRTTIPTIVITNTQGDSFLQIIEQIRFAGMVLNRSAESTRFEIFLEDITSIVKNRTRNIPADKQAVVFCGYDPTHLITYGNDSFLEERISIAGCKNAATLGSRNGSEEGKITPSQSEVTMEQVLAWNPDIIIIDSGTPEEIYQDKRWAPMKAVQNHQVFLQPQGIFKWSRPNAESAVFHPIWLAKIAYPDKFSDIDLSDLLKQYFDEFFHYHLSDLQISAILNGSYGQ